MKRSEILKEAEKCVCGEREQDYGTPENNFETIAGLWTVYLNASHGYFRKLGVPISAKDVGMMMSLLKIARIATGSSPDSFIDLAGYAACAGEICTKEKLKNENLCVSCGVSIPEGSQICPNCEKEGYDA